MLENIQYTLFKMATKHYKKWQDFNGRKQYTYTNIYLYIIIITIINAPF